MGAEYCIWATSIAPHLNRLVFRIRRRVASATGRALVVLGDNEVLSAFYEAWGMRAYRLHAPRSKSCGTD